jgi:hypothetical protein
LGDFNAKLGRGDILKATDGHEISHENSNDHGISQLYHIKILLRAQSSCIMMFLNSLGSVLIERISQIDHILIDMRKHSNILMPSLLVSKRAARKSGTVTA